MGADVGNRYRRSIRLAGYDYAQAGAYFVTICTRNRECLFGDVVDGEMRLNQYGAIVRDEWFGSAAIRREIELFDDEFVVMPNHIHGIVWIVETDNEGATGLVGVTDLVGATGRSPLPSKPRGPAKRSLSSFVAGFKSAVTKRINENRGAPGAPVWQRNYYACPDEIGEHIIRNDESLNRIREYIQTNPIHWEEDKENPYGNRQEQKQRGQPAAEARRQPTQMDGNARADRGQEFRPQSGQPAPEKQ